MKMKCYFAHPYPVKDTEEAKRIIEILEDRRVEVINPFTEDNKIYERHKIKGYFPEAKYKVGRDIWTKVMYQIDHCNMVVFWIPEDKRLPPIGHFMTTARGCYAEIQHAVEHQYRVLKTNKYLKEPKAFFIQFITRDRHPIIAWALCNGNQLYDDIDSFDRFKQTRWE